MVIIYNLYHEKYFGRIIYYSFFITLLFVIIPMFFFISYKFASDLLPISLILFFTNLFLLVLCYGMYVEYLIFYSDFYEDCFFRRYNIIQKYLKNYQIYQYSEIKKIEFYDLTVYIVVRNKTHSYSMLYVDDIKSFLQFLHRKSNLPIYDKVNNVIIPN